MAERPIIFSAPMVRALLEGRKTQTRRVLKPQFPDWVKEAGFTCFTPEGHASGRGIYVDEQGLDHGPAEKFVRLPYAVGDRLWCREAWRTCAERDAVAPLSLPGDTPLLFECDDPERANTLALWGRLRAAMHMPRRYSRLTLTVTDVRVQRLQEISEDDAAAEGVRRTYAGGEWGEEGLIEDFADLWNSLHGPAAWDANPWICALTFTVERRNIDAATPPEGE